MVGCVHAVFSLSVHFLCCKQLKSLNSPSEAVSQKLVISLDETQRAVFVNPESWRCSIQAGCKPHFAAFLLIISEMMLYSQIRSLEMYLITLPVSVIFYNCSIWSFSSLKVETGV